MQGRDSSAGHLQACIPALQCTKSYINEKCHWDKAVQAMLYKHGPQHDLDLVEKDMEEELNANDSELVIERMGEVYLSLHGGI